jgi:hypothetical protein
MTIGINEKKRTNKVILDIKNISIEKNLHYLIKEKFNPYIS